MELYKVLLVDDELEIRDGMEKKLNWEELGFQIAGLAANGIEALEKATALRPDVILTDIRMPFMDGLELTERVRESLPLTKIIVFSGYDDFEYAKKAIAVGVEDYILKPVSALQLAEALRKLKQKMDADLAAKRDLESLRRAYEENVPFLRDQLLIDILEGEVSTEKLRELAERFRLSFVSSFLSVAVFSCHRPRMGTNGEAGFQLADELIPIAVRKHLHQELDEDYAVVTLLNREQIIAIIGMETGTEIHRLYGRLNAICQTGRQVTGAVVAAGLGETVSNPAELKRSYDRARSALEYSVLLGKDGEYAVYAGDIKVNEQQPLHLEDYEEKNLIAAIKANNEERLAEQLAAFFDRIEAARLPIYQYQTYLMEIFAVVLKVMGSFQLDIREVFGEDQDYLDHLFGGAPLADIRCWLLGVCRKLSTSIYREKMDAGKELVVKAKAYVEEHYADVNLSVEQICEVLHVSPSYFSTVFKRETGENFVAYLTDLRIAEAKVLLATTADKTYLIAGQVGYSEPNYFSYVFKKKVGTSPTAYRKQLAGD